MTSFCYAIGYGIGAVLGAILAALAIIPWAIGIAWLLWTMAS